MTSPFPYIVQRIGRRFPLLAEASAGAFVLIVVLILGRLGAWP